MTIVDDPGNSYNVDELYVFLSVDEGGEGICGGPMGPMVAGRRKTAEMMLRKNAKKPPA
jgi:hypothetical protein